MHRVSKSALVPHSPDAMYRLVADIESYPQFLPWCAGAEVHERSEGHVVASLDVAKGPLRKRLTTRNVLYPERAIDLGLVEGPFRHLHGRWRFSDVGGAGCKVELELEFEIGNPVLRKVLGPVFGEIANTMVDAFCRRAADLYGGG